MGLDGGQGDVERLGDAGKREAALVAEEAEALLTLLLNEWYFSINLNVVSAFNFDTNTDITVRRLGVGEVLSKNMTGRDVIDEEATQIVVSGRLLRRRLNDLSQ